MVVIVTMVCGLYKGLQGTPQEIIIQKLLHLSKKEKEALSTSHLDHEFLMQIFIQIRAFLHGLDSW